MDPLSNPADVEAMARNVIVHLGMPFTLISVDASPTGWTIQVRGGSGILNIAIPGGQPLAMRRAIEEKLEAEF